jgi:hypothetical protein
MGLVRPPTPMPTAIPTGVTDEQGPGGHEGGLNSVSGLVFKLWYRSVFDQSDSSKAEVRRPNLRRTDRGAILE